MVIPISTETQVSLSEAVTAEIRAEIARQGVRRSAFADKIGVPVHWLTNRLNGIVTLNLDDLAKIAGGLEVEPNALIERSAK